MTGVQTNTTVSKLQGLPLANAAPTTNQVLKWNGSVWSLADDAIGTPGSGGTTGDMKLSVVTSTIQPRVSGVFGAHFGQA